MLAGQLDLFELAAGPILTPAQRRRMRGKRSTEQRGYADHPGTGPRGEFCKTCAHIVRARKYRKCELRRATWTHGPRTDILANAAACSKWEKATP
jgi:hypothetical protein